MVIDTTVKIEPEVTPALTAEAVDMDEEQEQRHSRQAPIMRLVRWHQPAQLRAARLVIRWYLLSLVAVSPHAC